MRVLAKPELDHAVILNEFALILENFGVPLLENAVEEEEDYIPEGEQTVRSYDLKNIDDEGIQILESLAKFLLKEYMHPREFFGKMVKMNQQIKNSNKLYTVDTLSVKDFYLKIKIANLRKTLQENASLNAELCLDPKLHTDKFNMKTFVRALEDIAEVEQEKMFEEEENKAQTQAGMTPPKPPKKELSSALISESADTPIEKEETASTEMQKEVVRFGKGAHGKRRSPKPASKFTALGTIDEAVNETATSMVQESLRDDESRISHQLKSSNHVDFDDSMGQREVMQKLELLNRSDLQVKRPASEEEYEDEYQED